MWIIFEDSEQTPVGELIKYIYSNTNVNIDFAGGAGNFAEKVFTKPVDDYIVIFFDLIADNPETAKDYKILMRKLRHRENVCIIPTLSLDYMILKAFTNKRIDPEYISSLDYSVDERITSIEKYYKYILDNYSDCMSLGRFSNINEMTSIFYSTDCKCERYERDCRENYNRYSKGLDLLYAMPLFISIKCGKPSCPFKPEEYIRRVIKEHNNLVELISKKRNWNNRIIQKAFIDESIIR